jgi:hypothetical protein
MAAMMPISATTIRMSMTENPPSRATHAHLERHEA